MTVRALRKKNGKHKCSYCSDDARYRGFMFFKFSCEKHLGNLILDDRREQAPDTSDAEYALFGRE